MDGYTAADLLGQLGDGVQVILPWVGAGVGSALALFFVFLGIRAGFRFFRAISGADNWSAGDDAQSALDHQKVDDVLNPLSDADFEVWDEGYRGARAEGYDIETSKDFGDAFLMMDDSARDQVRNKRDTAGSMSDGW